MPFTNEVIDFNFFIQNDFSNFTVKTEPTDLAVKSEPLDSSTDNQVVPTESRFSVKIEPKEEPIDLIEMSAEIKEEPDSDECDSDQEFIDEIRNRTELPPNLSPEERELYNYKCRICAKKFTSRYAFTLHVNKHAKKCQHCRVAFKTWKELENHRQFCSRRFGRIEVRRPERQPRRTKPKNLPFKCQLCARKYETFKHLFNHQFLRCSKRYRTPAWIVKI